MKTQASLGIIIGNRDFFPDSLVEKARTEILDVFKQPDVVVACKPGDWNAAVGVSPSFNSSW